MFFDGEEIAPKFFKLYNCNASFQMVKDAIISYELLDKELQIVFDFDKVNIQDIIDLSKDDVSWFTLSIFDDKEHELTKVNLAITGYPKFELSQGQGVPDIWVALKYSVQDVSVSV